MSKRAVATALVESGRALQFLTTGLELVNAKSDAALACAKYAITRSDEDRAEMERRLEAMKAAALASDQAAKENGLG